MNEAAFNDLVEQTLMDIEDAVDNSGLDIDCENSGGVLTLTLDDGSVIIFSRQIASRELWVAARSGGYHLMYKDSQWYCEKQQQSLSELFAVITKEQAGAIIEME